jgi:hypothetical protein
MKLIIVYVAFVIVGVFGSYLIGRTVEMWSSTLSLTVFLGLFFFVFWAAWRLAVRVT